MVRFFSANDDTGWGSGAKFPKDKQWKRTRPGCMFYKVSCLAMYPQTGEGFTFARTAIEHAVPAGAGIYTAARSIRHRVIYARAGLYPLPSKARYS